MPAADQPPDFTHTQSTYMWALMCTRVPKHAALAVKTETVWRTAQKHEIPAIAFVNKLDRQGADFKHVLGTLERRLGVLPLPLQARAPSTIIQKPMKPRNCSSVVPYAFFAVW